MEELVNFLKELLLIKKEEKKIVGLTSLKKMKKVAAKKPVKKQQKELKLSELMRRHKVQNSTAPIKTANSSSLNRNRYTKNSVK